MKIDELEEVLDNHKLWLNGNGGKFADLCDANLCDANLCGADLRGANLCGADLPSPSIVLLANWGKCCPETTAALMRLDASAHPIPEMFDAWASGGKCPYGNTKFQRVAVFREDKDLWSPGPPPTIWDAMVMVLDEHTKWRVVDGKLTGST